jgi:alpha-glucosidase
MLVPDGAGRRSGSNAAGERCTIETVPLYLRAIDIARRSLRMSIWTLGLPSVFAIITASGLLMSTSAFGQAPGKGERVALQGQALTCSISRFHPAGDDPAKYPPSIALASPGTVKFAGDAKASTILPSFWKSNDDKFCVRVDTTTGTSLYGTGEIAGPLLRNGRKTVCWNTDAYGYTDEQPSLYQSHPWVLAVRADGSAFGVLADTTWRVEIDLTGVEKSSQAESSIVFRGEGASFPVWVIEGATPQEVVKGLASLIGPMPMPPKWAIGYHQCRYSYYPEARVREIAQNFRDRRIPADVIWMDIDYMDQYKVFTFDKTHFPSPRKLNEDLARMGFSNIWMIDPGIKAEKGYSIADQMEAKNLMVRGKNGEPYKGEVWPGWCYFPDYTRSDVRSWWAGLYADFMVNGISGVWNDMNEPAVFNVKSKTMPEDNRHEGGAWDSGFGGGGVLPPGPHLQYHNVYGLMMAKGTYDGILAARPEKRPFVLTRAGYIGSQRYAATWTGDNSAEWDDLEASVSMAANLGLSGAPFIGPDIGGFNGNGDGKMFARWMGVGSLLPFCRGHTGKGNIDKEPWAFGPEVEHTCKLALERRYRLLPYLYTLFQEASTSGLPVLRPVFFADPKDPALRSEDDAFLLGSDLLVVPKLTPERDRTPVLPKGIWNEVMLVDEGHHPDLPRLYVRGGAIVPVGPVVQWTGEKTLDPLTLLVSLDAAGNATGTLYEDAGDGFGFKQGEYLKTTYIATTQGDKVRIEISQKEGKMPRIPRDLRVIVLKDGWYYAGGGTDGQALTFLLQTMTPAKFNTEPPRLPKSSAAVE